MATPFLTVAKDGLAVGGKSLSFRDMWQRMKDEWRMSRPETKVILILGLLVMAVLFAAMVYILRNWQSADPTLVPVETRTSETEPQMTTDAEIVAPRSAASQAVLNQYFGALGGAQALAGLRSVRASGELTFPDGMIARAVIIKKEGGLVRMTLGVAPNQIVMAVHPEDAWQSSWRDGNIHVQELDPEQAASMRRSANPRSKLFMAMQNDWSFSYLGEKPFEYELAHVFEVRISESEAVRYFIDPDTFAELGTEEWLDRGSGPPTVTRHVQSEHFESGGLQFPGKIETYVDGKLSHSFVVQDVEVNPGILTEAFVRPGDNF